MSYSRLGYLALKVETTENVAVLPNVFAKQKRLSRISSDQNHFQSGIRAPGDGAV